jgi:hypothetical protein
MILWKMDSTIVFVVGLRFLAKGHYFHFPPTIETNVWQLSQMKILVL